MILKKLFKNRIKIHENINHVEEKLNLNEVKWLPHLENSIPDSMNGYSLSFYSIALEGWRRGLSLRFINKNRAKAHTPFILSSDTKSHEFQVSRGDLVPREAIKNCIDKYKTKQLLIKGNVPTPTGEKFTNKSRQKDIIKFARKLGYPIVIKPTDGTGGKGVIAGIENKKQLISAIDIILNELKFKNVIVEKHFEGEDYRVYVVDNEAVAVTKRIPANIVGDGINTIKTLIRKKNKLRQSSPILGASLIKIDSELNNMIERKGYTLNSIPKKDEVIYLKSKNNITAGGDPADITDIVSDEIKQIAINAANAIPGLVQAGVDLMVDKENNKAIVLEVNSRPSIRTHLFPVIGKGRDIPKKIIDYYFLETINNQFNDLLYFEFESIWEMISNNSAKEIKIPSIPKENIESTRYIVENISNHSKFAIWLKNRVNKLKLNGFSQHNENSLEITLVAEQKNMIEFRSELNNYNSSCLKITEENNTSPVKMGFLIHEVKQNNNIVHEIERLKSVIEYKPVRLKDV